MQPKSALTRLGKSNPPLAVVHIDFPDLPDFTIDRNAMVVLKFLKYLTPTPTQTVAIRPIEATKLLESIRLIRLIRLIYSPRSALPLPSASIVFRSM
jgi:hypothetical protein